MCKVCCTDVIVHIAYCRLSTWNFKKMLRILKAWDDGLISPNFAKYEILHLVDTKPGMKTLFDTYFDMMDLL